MRSSIVATLLLTAFGSTMTTHGNEDKDSISPEDMNATRTTSLAIRSPTGTAQRGTGSLQQRNRSHSDTTRNGKSVTAITGNADGQAGRIVTTGQAIGSSPHSNANDSFNRMQSVIVTSASNSGLSRGNQPARKHQSSAMNTNQQGSLISQSAVAQGEPPRLKQGAKSRSPEQINRRNARLRERRKRARDEELEERAQMQRLGQIRSTALTGLKDMSKIQLHEPNTPRLANDPGQGSMSHGLSKEPAQSTDTKTPSNHGYGRVAAQIKPYQQNEAIHGFMGAQPNRAPRSPPTQMPQFRQDNLQMHRGFSNDGLRFQGSAGSTQTVQNRGDVAAKPFSDDPLTQAWEAYKQGRLGSP